MKKTLAQCILLFVLFIISNITFSYLGIITFFICLLLILKNNNIKNIYLLFYLIPNIRILDKTGITYLINLLMFAIALKYILFDDSEKAKLKKRIDAKLIIYTLIVLGIELLHFLVSDKTLWSTMFISINIAFDFLACVKLIRKEINYDNFKKMGLFLLVGVANSSIVYLISNPNTIYRIYNSAYRFQGFGSDPNYLSTYIIVGVAILLFSGLKSKNNFLEIMLIILSISFGLMTSSKMYMICIALTIILYILSLIIKGNIKKTILTILITTTIIILVFSIFGNNISFLLSKVIDRFNINDNGEYSMSGLTTGRSTLFEQYLMFLNSDTISLLLGRGTNYLNYYRQFGMNSIAHNTYLDFILSWGIIGTFVFIVSFINSIKKYITVKGKTISDYIPFLLFIIMLFSLSCMSADMFWYQLALVLIPLKTNILNIKENK